MSMRYATLEETIEAELYTINASPRIKVYALADDRALLRDADEAIRKHLQSLGYNVTLGSRPGNAIVAWGTNVPSFVLI